MKIKRRVRVALIASGVVFLCFGVVAQMSSVLTPTLAQYPTLLYVFGSLGIDFLFIGGLAYFLFGIYTRQLIYYIFSILSFFALLIASFTLIGRVFQFSLFALTIGGGLIVLGSLRGHLIAKRRS